MSNPKFVKLSSCTTIHTTTHAVLTYKKVTTELISVLTTTAKYATDPALATPVQTFVSGIKVENNGVIVSNSSLNTVNIFFNGSSPTPSATKSTAFSFKTFLLKYLIPVMKFVVPYIVSSFLKGSGDNQFQLNPTIIFEQHEHIIQIFIDSETASYSDEALLSSLVESALEDALPTPEYDSQVSGDEPRAPEDEVQSSADEHEVEIESPSTEPYTSLE